LRIRTLTTCRDNNNSHLLNTQRNQTGSKFTRHRLNTSPENTILKKKKIIACFFGSRTNRILFHLMMMLMFSDHMASLIIAGENHKLETNRNEKPQGPASYDDHRTASYHCNKHTHTHYGQTIQRFGPAGTNQCNHQAQKTPSNSHTIDDRSTRPPYSLRKAQSKATITANTPQTQQSIRAEEEEHTRWGGRGLAVGCGGLPCSGRRRGGRGEVQETSRRGGGATTGSDRGSPRPSKEQTLDRVRPLSPLRGQKNAAGTRRLLWARFVSQPMTEREGVVRSTSR